MNDITRQLKSTAMKKIVCVLIGVILISCFSSGMPESDGKSVTGDSLIIYSTQEYSTLVQKWAEMYGEAFPGMAVNVAVVPAAGILSGLQKGGSIAFLPGESADQTTDPDATLRMVVARNIIIPVINPENPFLTEIQSKGISPGKLAGILKNGDRHTWGELLGGGQTEPVKLFYVDEASVISGMSALSGPDVTTFYGTPSDANSMLSAVMNDKYSIGFCRLTNIQDPSNESVKDGILILPLDRNANGTLDSNEDIYSDMSAFTRGVWIGKYPRELYSSLYSITSTPSSENAAAFLNWVITDGQKILYPEGYTGLLLAERMSASGKIAEAQITSVTDARERNVFASIFMLLAGLAVVIFGADRIISTFRRKPVAHVSSAPAGAFNADALILPMGLYFDKTHTWAFLEQTGSVKVGVDDFLLHLTGALSRIKMKSVGERVKKGQEILSVIQNGKQLTLYSPVSGTIKEKNTLLENNISVLNSSPYNEGWVYRIEPDNWHRENQLLFMAGKHKAFIGEEMIKIRDFLAGIVSKDNQLAPVVLQDGGMIADGTLSHMDPEVWEEFQTRIIDPSRQVWFYEIL